MTVIGGLLVPLYFLLVTLAVGVLAWYFLAQKKESLRYFGFGLVGYTLGSFFWTLVVLLKPEDLKPLILAGAIPFLLAHLPYAKVASKNRIVLIITSVLIFVTLYARTYLFPSQPYFSSQGLLYFGLTLPVGVLYVLTLSVSFLPAIINISKALKNKKMARNLRSGLLVLYITSVVLVLIKDDTILLFNGVVMTLALLLLVIEALRNKK